MGCRQHGDSFPEHIAVPVSFLAQLLADALQQYPIPCCPPDIACLQRLVVEHIVRTLPTGHEPASSNEARRLTLTGAT